MMKVTLVLCMLAVTSAAPSQRAQYDGHQLLRLVPENTVQLRWLEEIKQIAGPELDFWLSPSHVDQEVLIHVEPQGSQAFLQTASTHGLQGKVVVENIQDLVDAEAESISQARRKRGADFDVNAYGTSQEILSWMDHLALTHSRVMSVNTIGKSYESRALKVAKVSSGGSGKPAIFINSGFHSREWIAHASVIWILNEMVTRYGLDAEVTSLVNKFDWYFMPLANPDGYDYSHDVKRLWRKTRSPGGRGCYGTDPNRNWDMNFGGEGASQNPCQDDFHGTHAFSEPETLAMAKYLTSIKDNLHMYIDVHAFSQLWMESYGYTNGAKPADSEEMNRVANIGAKAIERVNGNAFRVGTPWELLYAASGGSFDWAKGVLGVKYCYALELRPAGGSLLGFFVSPAEIPDSGRETLAGIAAAANAMQLH